MRLIAQGAASNLCFALRVGPLPFTQPEAKADGYNFFYTRSQLAIALMFFRWLLGHYLGKAVLYMKGTISL